MTPAQAAQLAAAYAETNVGVWADKKTSRSAGTVYTNTSANCIDVQVGSVNVGSNMSYDAFVLPDGVTWFRAGYGYDATAAGDQSAISFACGQEKNTR